MKLHKTHLFLLLIAVLVLSTLGFTVKEYFDNKESSSEESSQESSQDKNPESALEKMKEGNQVYQIPISQSKYQSLISDLEDVVVPERKQRKHHHDTDVNKRNHHHGNNGNHINGHSRKKEKDEDEEDKDVERQERQMAQDAGVDMSKYILKSEVVPPVCPKCPDSRTCPREKPCPPCAPCARCPEPAFECKKVPNYRAASVSNVLPLPRLNSFAAF